MSADTNAGFSSPEKLRILVAEDEELIRDFIVRVLVGAGHRPHAVGNGDDALVELRGSSYDVAILDVLMPGPGGVEIAKRYRASHEQPIPIIVLTACTTRSTSVECLTSGVDVVLTKPVTRQELLDTINKVLAGHTPYTLPGSRSVPAQDVLDDSKLDELSYNDPTGEFRKQFLRKFLSRANDIVRHIEQAAQENNPAAIYELVHKLEGSAGTAGAAAIENACGALRADIRPHERQERVAELKRAVAEVARQLNQKYYIGAQE